jgi:hypothetical protein
MRNGWPHNSKKDGNQRGKMVVIELAIQTLVTMKFSNILIIVQSDNQGVVGALKAGRLQGSQQNTILCEIIRLIQEYNLWILTIWIPTSENLADSPLRGVFTNKRLLYAFPPKILFYLVKFVHNAVDYHDQQLL